MQNVKCEIIKGTNKNGQPYKALQFSIMTSQGVYKSGLIFPSNLEMALIEKAISPIQDIYSSGDTSPNSDRDKAILEEGIF